MVYKTKGVCSSAIEFEIEDDIIKDIQSGEAAREIPQAWQPL